MKTKTSAIWLLLVVVGIVLLIIGLTIKIPGKKLRQPTYEILGVGEDEYPVKQYVGGDAYNYIIAAELCAGEISAKTTEKTLYICFGAFMITLGIALTATDSRQKNKSV